jgi:hypothetical protein
VSGWRQEPAAGDIVWCHFPDGIRPRAKARPALVIAVWDGSSAPFDVKVAYGTSQRTNSLHRGEFAILRNKHPTAYCAANLSYDTKFDLRNVIDLPYTTDWFSVPPFAPNGQCPKLGILHPAMMRTVEAAFRATGK